MTLVAKGLMKLDWTDYGKIFKYQISWKSVQWEPSCSMRTDGRTDGQNNVNIFHPNRTLYNIPATKLQFQIDKCSCNIPFLFSAYSAWWWLPSWSKPAAACSYNFNFQEQSSVYNERIYSVDLNPNKHNTRYVHHLLSHDTFPSLHSPIFRWTTPARKWQCLLPTPSQYTGLTKTRK